jgi:hypothetical protein
MEANDFQKSHRQRKCISYDLQRLASDVCLKVHGLSDVALKLEELPSGMTDPRRSELIPRMSPASIVEEAKDPAQAEPFFDLPSSTQPAAEVSQ